ncbi:MAG: PTS transporter subunit EIIC [Erysipelotrichaceae bacterium]|nr:PTS transporter subunit EIIC [Erysipelotrichaceae bacterium]
MEKEYKAPEILALTASRNNGDDVLKAAEALGNKAKELGVNIKIETFDGKDVRNELTKDEILNCKGIIVATDTNVVMKRFAGKQIQVTSLVKAINEAEDLIRSILEDKAPVAEVSERKESAVQHDLKDSVHLNKTAERISYFLPIAVVAGAICVSSLLLTGDKSSVLYQFLNALDNDIFDILPVAVSVCVAYLIGGRWAVSTGLIGGLISKAGYSISWFYDQSTQLKSGGLIGALCIGIIAGYLIRIFDRLSSSMPSSLNKVRYLLIYPLCGALIISLIALGLDPVFSMVNSVVTSFFETYGISDHIITIILFFISLICILTDKFNKRSD